MKKAASDEKVKYWQELISKGRKSQLIQQKFCEEGPVISSARPVATGPINSRKKFLFPHMYIYSSWSLRDNSLRLNNSIYRERVMSEFLE